ncbi:hypothetical protein BN3590_03600 [Clostridium sp. C105KSO15]|nr:hypothetical protein BN3590_03600 [Clostridium sp. C105KSO15]
MYCFKTHEDVLTCNCCAMRITKTRTILDFAPEIILSEILY